MNETLRPLFELCDREDITFIVESLSNMTSFTDDEGLHIELREWDGVAPLPDTLVEGLEKELCYLYSYDVLHAIRACFRVKADRCFGRIADDMSVRLGGATLSGMAVDKLKELARDVCDAALIAASPEQQREAFRNGSVARAWLPSAGKNLVPDCCPSLPAAIVNGIPRKVWDSELVAKLRQKAEQSEGSVALLTAVLWGYGCLFGPHQAKLNRLTGILVFLGLVGLRQTGNAD